MRQKLKGIYGITILFVITLVVFGCGSKAGEYKVSVIDEDRFTDGPGSAMTSVEFINEAPVSSPQDVVSRSMSNEFAAQVLGDHDKAASEIKARAALFSDADISFEEKIQNALKNAGYYDGPVDIVISEDARKAIRSFQKSHNLKPDGIVGTKTWSSLKKYYYVSDDE
jgi:hypothetical protein